MNVFYSSPIVKADFLLSCVQSGWGCLVTPFWDVCVRNWRLKGGEKHGELASSISWSDMIVFHTRAFNSVGFLTCLLVMWTLNQFEWILSSQGPAFSLPCLGSDQGRIGRPWIRQASFSRRASLVTRALRVIFDNFILPNFILGNVAKLLEMNGGYRLSCSSTRCIPRAQNVLILFLIAS